MSIWASYGAIGWEPEGTVWDGRRTFKSHARFERGAVIAYRAGWSNAYPDVNRDPGATVGVASIPDYCVPGHKDEDGDRVGPWLRLDIDSPDAKTYGAGLAEHPAPVHGSVVMDEAAVRALRDDLDAWLEREKVRPA